MALLHKKAPASTVAAFAQLKAMLSRPAHPLNAELLILARDAGSAIVGNEDVRHHQLGCN